MAFPGAYLVIICTILLHFTTCTTILWLINISDADSKVVMLCVQGFVYISYPLMGLLADIKLTRYRMICLSCLVLFVIVLLFSIGNICFILTNDLQNVASELYPNIYLALCAVAVLLGIVGKGMFESTVIQFGTDQMIEASSAQLSTFIHWYYWSQCVGSICITSVIAGMAEYYGHCNINIQLIQESKFGKYEINLVAWKILPVNVIQCISCCITLLLLYLKKFKKYLNIEPVGVNPIKQIIDVLKYAYHHKYPVRRSALSYYLNTYPPRIDFGKVQYGGPFTNEQVEDTKTVLRLLVLLLSLIGFHLSGDGFSTVSQILHKTCPSSLILLMIISNPNIALNILTFLSIPLFYLLVKSSLKKWIPNMMKRMWFGLLMLFIQEVLSLIIYKQIEHSTCGYLNETNKYCSSSLICYYSLIEFANDTVWNTTDCVNVCPSSLYTMDSTLMWLLVPQILQGFGYMLVFVSVLEFICAQAPFRLKGFMVGIWYAMFSIKYIFVDIIEFFITSFYKEDRAWIIYESIRIGIIGLSLIVFGICCRWYRYRERDEVVNVQGMIEDIFEKELNKQQNDEDEDTILITSQTDYHTFD